MAGDGHTRSLRASTCLVARQSFTSVAGCSRSSEGRRQRLRAHVLRRSTVVRVADGVSTRGSARPGARRAGRAFADPQRTIVSSLGTHPTGAESEARPRRGRRRRGRRLLTRGARFSYDLNPYLVAGRRLDRLHARAGRHRRDRRPGGAQKRRRADRSAAAGAGPRFQALHRPTKAPDGSPTDALSSSRARAPIAITTSSPSTLATDACEVDGQRRPRIVTRRGPRTGAASPSCARSSQADRAASENQELFVMRADGTESSADPPSLRRPRAGVVAGREHDRLRPPRRPRADRALHHPAGRDPPPPAHHASRRLPLGPRLVAGRAQHRLHRRKRRGRGRGALRDRRDGSRLAVVPDVAEYVAGPRWSPGRAAARGRRPQQLRPRV